MKALVPVMEHSSGTIVVTVKSSHSEFIFENLQSSIDVDYVDGALELRVDAYEADTNELTNTLRTIRRVG